MSKKIILSMAFFFIQTISVAASTYYVDLGGLDENDCSAEYPFRTIQKAADVVQPGDTVKVGPGLFNEFVTINTSGIPVALLSLRVHVVQAVNG
ncbi:MAG: DUF1565 domain-containing protein [Desulfobacteraceae bacterium]